MLKLHYIHIIWYHIYKVICCLSVKSLKRIYYYRTDDEVENSIGNMCRIQTRVGTGSPGHGSPGHRVSNLGRVGSGHGSLPQRPDPAF